jgi:hypothetical protein
VKRSWGTTTIGVVSILAGLLDILNSVGNLLFDPENTYVPLIASLSSFFYTFLLGAVIMTSGILTLRLHPWAPPLAIAWAAIVTSSMLVTLVPPAWEYLTYDHPPGTRVRWGATIGGILGALAYPSILFKFYSRPTTKQYFAVRFKEERELPSEVSHSRIKRWNPALWVLAIFGVLWIVSKEIFQVALMVLFVIMIFGLFELFDTDGSDRRGPPSF